MRVEFDRWAEVKSTWEKWWNRELGRPIVNLYVVDDEETVRQRLGPVPDLHYTRFTGQYDPDIAAEQIIDRYDYELASRRYVADGFPSTLPNFGPGALAAMTGCKLEVRDASIWFEPEVVVAANELSIPSTIESVVAGRVADFYREAVSVWGANVQLGMVDLGGDLDILQSFFPGSGLALELYDHPAEIQRLNDQVHIAWWDHFKFFNSLIAETNPGYTAWTPLLSEKSYYMLQCDFAYMIGPDQFSEFVLPELTRICAKLDRPFYHLDGEGQLAHLDKILGIPGLAGVQWIPGEGAHDITNWPEVYRKIRDSGKLIQFFLHQSDKGIDVLDVLADQLGDLSGVAVVGDVGAGAEEENARAVLERHGVPW